MSTATSTPPLAVDVHEAARLLGIGRDAVRGRIRSGELPSFRLGPAPNCKVMIRYADLEHWLAEQIDRE